MIRSRLVRALYENLIGPSQGSTELIEEPFLKYEMGILNSSIVATEERQDAQPTIDSEINPDPADVDAEALPGRQSAEDTGDTDSFRPDADTDLSFKTGAVSLGLHFVLKGDAPRFKICLTWARYVQDKEFGDTPRMFKRCPNFFVTGWIDANSRDREKELEGGVNGSVVTSPGAYMHVIKRRIGSSDSWIVKIFLENRTKYVENQREEDRIFQPQIRVVSDGRSELLDLDLERGQKGNGEREMEELLYRNYRAKAKGYMCAAVWGEVDPEADHGGEIGGMSWPDSKSVPKAVREEFTRPLVRTEYMPLYTVLQPDQSGRPAFDAGSLSHTWDPDDVELKLASIVGAYSEWIGRQKKRLGEEVADGEIMALGEENLKGCDEALQRIRNGIDFLKSSEKARAAFCFMNAAMNDKRLNEKRENLLWREFQMAFILQSLRGVSGASKAERELADVLWFPTGGGKTEAYLGIVIFALAYRRLTPGGARSNDGGVSVISRYTLRLLTIQQFQRALGAIVAADVRRVENWLPEGALRGSKKITDPYMLKRLACGALWGNQRFSIGLWIGSEATPKDFAYTTIVYGKVLLNCEGALLSHESDVRARASSGSVAEPAQVQACPVCENTLRIPENLSPGEPRRMTWIVRSPKKAEELRAIPKANLSNLQVTVREGPKLSHIGNASNNRGFFRLTMEIGPKRKTDRLSREAVDRWWKEVVRPSLDQDPNSDPLMSTSPSMPGYFFLRQPGWPRPHDFAIFCTDGECKLNKTPWFERLENSHSAPIPEPFQSDGGRSSSVPISAYTVDEQIYLKCPSLLIATVDKFANLPFVPKCASLFGNVDVLHPVYGYGRRSTFEAPLRQRNTSKRIEVEQELRDVAGFNPPSLILQDELHLIEGPLGSMVGAYEMAIDVLSDNGLKPKYIASSATIKETVSQVGTIFRRGIATFPPPGIDSADNYFSEILEDPPCARKRPGRLYLGIATTKSTVILPIKAQSIAMSEIFKIRSWPGKYGLTEEEREDLESETDPYWTFVSYFTDLQLMSKFNNYYSENVVEYVGKWSAEKAHAPGARAHNTSLAPGLRLFPLRADQDMAVSAVSVYCARGAGRIRVAIYRDGHPVGRLEHKFAPQACIDGENVFAVPASKELRISAGERVWVAAINDSESAVFQVVGPMEGALESRAPGAPIDFPEAYGGATPYGGNAPAISLNSPPRPLESAGNITLSSETKSEDLAANLERLQNEFDADSLQTSPVFGTGIDVDRLGIMEVMNQPKTSSGYIQSTGRVGRRGPGLVINWLRAGRVRDLNHYENFVGYHRALHRFVEPVTASPFSHKAMKLCLGPITVAILRNARSIRGAEVSPGWVDPQSGARNILGAYDAPDMRAVGEALKEIASSRFIAGFRRMPQKEFESIFNVSKASWRRVADISSSKAPGFQYAERNPSKQPTSNVVLGSPNHKDMELEYAYENTPISMRQTESTATFYRADDGVPIRPSQFTTRYGPGSLVAGKSVTWVVPNIIDLLGCLKGGNFDDPNNKGHSGLHKYEINDSRMKRILLRLHRDTGREKLKLFSLPTNSSLTIPDWAKLYRCSYLSRWSVCYSSAHTTKVLAAAQQIDGRWAVRCPECERATGAPDSTKFYGVRYFMACKRGHLGNVDWKYEVHRESGMCKGDVFEWRVSGGNDNAEIVCLGHWSGNRFVRSKCGGSVTYKELKRRSKGGAMACTARFAEGGEDPHGCERAGGASLAVMVSKTQMSLRMPIVATSMEIQRYKGMLVEYFMPVAKEIGAFTSVRPDFKKGDLAKFFQDQVDDETIGFAPNLPRVTAAASEREVGDAVEEVKKTLKKRGLGQDRLTELESLADELASLERQTRDHGTGSQVGPDDPPPDHRFPIPFSAMGIDFEAMPFGEIKVTQVQTGYTREITPPAQRHARQEQSDALRTGVPVRFSSRYKDDDGNLWYVANQQIGEGIFIHLDPDRHHDGADVLAEGGGATRTWGRIHEEISHKNALACKALGRERGRELEMDALEMENVLANPLFVWWHSFAHELINQLAIDSGFMGATLGERVYCVARGDKSYGAGVLIYASSPGADGTLGGLTSLVDEEVLQKIVEKTLLKTRRCSNDPLCSDRRRSPKRTTGAACHACLMNSETSCAYQNKFLDRNVVMEALET